MSESILPAAGLLLGLLLGAGLTYWLQRPLRIQVSDLTDALVRIKRVQSGMREAPRNGKPKEREKMPKAVQRIIDGFESPEMRSRVQASVRQARQKGMEWSEIEQSLREQAGAG